MESKILICICLISVFLECSKTKVWDRLIKYGTH